MNGIMNMTELIVRTPERLSARLVSLHILFMNNRKISF